MGYDERWWVEREVRRERAVGGGGVYGRASPAMGCMGVEPWLDADMGRQAAAEQEDWKRRLAEVEEAARDSMAKVMRGWGDAGEWTRR